MKRKVILYFMIIIIFTLGLVMIGFSIGIREYYYRGIANTFQSQAEAVPSVWTKQTEFANANLVNFSDEIIKNYQFKGAELQLLKVTSLKVQNYNY